MEIATATSWPRNDTNNMGIGDVKKILEKPAAAHVATGGLPLATSIGSLLAYGELFNKLDDYLPALNNPAFRFAAIVKLAGWTGIPIHVGVEHLFDTRRDISLGAKLKDAFKREVFLNGEKLVSWATAGKVATWFPRTTFGMGGGMLFANLGEYFFGEALDKNLKGLPNEVAKMSFFFTQEIADVLTIGGFSKLLAKRGVKSVFVPLAVVNGGGFTVQMIDYGFSALLFGGAEANYMNSVSFRTATTPHWADPLLLPIMGKGFKAHMVSGRGLGALVDRMQDGAAYLGLIDEENKYYNIRARIYEDDERNSKTLAEVIKGEMRALLARERINDWSAAIWKAKISAGWLEDVDLGSLNHACNPDIQQTLKSIANLAILITPATDDIRRIFSKEVIGLEKDEQFPSGAAVIADGMEEEFLKWLGGKDVILKLRRRMLIMSLIEAEMKVLRQNAESDDAELVKAGVRAGFGLNDAAFFEELERMIFTSRMEGNYEQLRGLNDYYAHKIATLGPAAVEAAEAAKRNVFDELESKVRSKIAKDIATQIVLEHSNYIEDIMAMPSARFREFADGTTCRNDPAYALYSILSEGAEGVKSCVSQNQGKCETQDLTPFLKDIKHELANLTGRDQDINEWFKSLSIETNSRAERLKENIARQWVAASILHAINGGELAEEFTGVMQMEANRPIRDEAKSIVAAYKMLEKMAPEVRGGLLRPFGTRNDTQQALSVSCTRDLARLERQQISELARELKEEREFKDYNNLAEVFASGAFTKDGRLGEIAALKEWFADEEAGIIKRQLASLEERLAELKEAQNAELSDALMLALAINALKAE